MLNHSYRVTPEIHLGEKWFAVCIGSIMSMDTHFITRMLLLLTSGGAKFASLDIATNDAESIGSIKAILPETRMY